MHRMVKNMNLIKKHVLLVVYLPLWQIWKSVGMIIPDNYMETKIENVPKHQSDVKNA